MELIQTYENMKEAWLELGKGEGEIPGIRKKACAGETGGKGIFCGEGACTGKDES